MESTTFVKNYDTLLDAILTNCPNCNKTCMGDRNYCDINPYNDKNYRRSNLKIKPEVRCDDKNKNNAITH